MNRKVLLPALLALACCNVATADVAQQLESYEQKIEQQQRELDALRAELDALRATLGVEATAAPAPAAAPEPVVERKSDNGNLKLSGRVHRMLMNVDDGIDTTGLFADSLQGPTMLRVDADMAPRGDWSVSGIVEVGIQENSAFSVSQENKSTGTSLSVRLGSVDVSHKRLGKMSFGRGFAASWVTPEVDASGTQLASLLSVGMLAPSLKFADASTNQLSDITVGTYFIDLERLLRLDRVRYDSPVFAGGMQVASSVSVDSRWDVALKARPSVDGWALTGAVTYQNEPVAGIKRRYDGAFSARHENTGLNLTLGISDESFDNGLDPSSYVIKGGWLADLNSLGKTAFSVDYYRQDDLRLAGDKAESIGFVVLQKWLESRLDFYAAYRMFDVERSDITLKDLDVIYVGAALSF